MTPDSVATKRANRAQRMLRRIVGASPDVIYVYHALWDRIAFLGRQVHEVLGRAALPSRRLRLTEFERLVHPADRPGLRRHLASFERSAEGEILSHQIRIKAADGRYRWLRGRGTVLARTPDGRVAKVVVANQDLTDVIETKQELRDLSGRIYSLREEERQRIAQELHDSTAQHLVAATLNLMTLRAKAAVSYPGVNNLLESVETSLEEATRELRAFTYLLHPLALDNDGLEQTLRTYLDGFARRTGLDAQASVAGDVESLPFALQCSLLRIIQEALANVHRHAAASHVSLSLRTTADAVELIVADDGCGMGGRAEEGACNGMGIPGMRARLREFDGGLEIRAGPHRGTTIVARIPLAAVRRRPAVSRLAIEGAHRLE
jgi:signal transduction histidine kinase